MFKDSKAFSSFSVDDVPRAKEFYGGTLGLSLDDQMGGLALHLSGGGEVFVYPKGDDHVPASFTVLNLPVDDIEQAVDRLSGAGGELRAVHRRDADGREGDRPRPRRHGDRLVQGSRGQHPLRAGAALA